MLLEAKPGLAHVLTGINGAGKTTFMLNLREELRNSNHKISLCTQKPLTTLSHWRVADLLEFMRTQEKHAIDTSLLDQLDFLNQMNLSKLETTPVMKLSGGENQALKLYLTLIVKADFYFLDEPTTFLDKKKKEYLLRVLKAYKQKQKTLFMIEHHHTFIDQIADHVWQMLENKDLVQAKMGESYV